MKRLELLLLFGLLLLAGCMHTTRIGANPSPEILAKINHDIAGRSGSATMLSDY